MKYFTVAEANALLPTLRVMMNEVMTSRQHILQVKPEIWPVLEKSVNNGGSKKAGEVLQHFEKIQKNVKSIQALGLEVKDINTGLVDFPALIAGREVYLCWRYDEPRVAHWHDLDAGFAGRQPLSD